MHEKCNLKLFTFTKNSNDSWRVASEFEHVWARSHLNSTPPVNQTLSRHDVIWQQLSIYSYDSCGVISYVLLSNINPRKVYNVRRITEYVNNEICV